MGSDQPPNQEPEPNTTTATEIKQEWRPGSYAALALISLLIGLGAGAIPLSEEDIAGVRFDRAYYVILVVIGVSAAIFLFGVMRSTARIQGKHWGAAYDFGGPAALFIIVVVGGFYLTQPAATFNSMIRLQYVGPPVNRDAYEQVLPKSKLRVSIGTSTNEYYLSQYGEVELKETPGRFRDGSFHCDVVPGDLALVDHDGTKALKFPAADQVVLIKATLRESQERQKAREKTLEYLNQTIKEIKATEKAITPVLKGQSIGYSSDEFLKAATTPLEQATEAVNLASEFNTKFGGIKGLEEAIQTLKAVNDKGVSTTSDKVKVDMKFGPVVKFQCTSKNPLFPLPQQQCSPVVVGMAYETEFVDLTKGVLTAHDTVAKRLEPIIAELSPGGG